jgi:hypothetical protein
MEKKLNIRTNTQNSGSAKIKYILRKKIQKRYPYISVKKQQTKRKKGTHCKNIDDYIEKLEEKRARIEKWI